MTRRMSRIGSRAAALCRQSADLLAPVGQEGHVLVRLQALTFEQIEQTAFGFGIISMHQTDVTGIAVFRYRLTDDDLEIGLSIVPVTYIAAIEADHSGLPAWATEPNPPDSHR